MFYRLQFNSLTELQLYISGARALPEAPYRIYVYIKMAGKMR